MTAADVKESVPEYSAVSERSVHCHMHTMLGKPSCPAPEAVAYPEDVKEEAGILQGLR
jgi:hypothetical protein